MAVSPIGTYSTQLLRSDTFGTAGVGAGVHQLPSTGDVPSTPSEPTGPVGNTDPTPPTPPTPPTTGTPIDTQPPSGPEPPSPPTPPLDQFSVLNPFESQVREMLQQGVTVRPNQSF